MTDRASAHALAERLEQIAIILRRNHYGHDDVLREAAALLREARPDVEAIVQDLQRLKACGKPSCGHGICHEIDAILAKLEATAPTPAVPAPANLVAAVRTILRGFDEGVFVRSTEGDTDSAWAIKLFPFIQALGQAQKISSEWEPPPTPERPTWQPIASAPKDGTNILVATQHWIAVSNWHYEDRWWTWHPPLHGERVHRNMVAEPPTHWLPLPAPPSSRPAPSENARLDEAAKALRLAANRIYALGKTDQADETNEAAKAAGWSDERFPEIRIASSPPARPAEPPALTTWMTTENPVERDAAYLRMYAEHVRNGTDLTWDIPNTRAATLGDIATRMLAASPPAPERGTCQWTEDDDGSWDTACGNKYSFIDGTPTINRQKFCGYCGATLVEKLWSGPLPAPSSSRPAPQEKCSTCGHDTHGRGSCWVAIGMDDSGVLMCKCLASSRPAGEQA